MLEPMPDAFPLSRRVLQQNSELPQVKTTTGELDTVAASAYAVGLTSSTRATRVNHQIVDAQQKRPLNFFAKGGARLLQHQVVRRSEVYEVVAVNRNRRDLS